VQALEVEPLTEFFDAIRSPVTKVKFEKRVYLFFRDNGVEGLDLQKLEELEKGSLALKKEVQEIKQKVQLLASMIQKQQKRGH
jgi:hypothetical protein